MKGKRPPGPGFFETLFSWYKMEYHPWEYLGRLTKKYGGVVYIRFPFLSYYFVNEPKAVKHILKNTNTLYDKQTRLWEITKKAGGVGITTSEGAVWKRQRQYAMAQMSPKKIEDYLLAISEIAEKEAKKGAAQGKVDVSELAMRFPLKVVVRCLFGIKEYKDWNAFIDLINKLVKRFSTGTKQLIPLNLPLVMNYRFKRDRKAFFENIKAIIRLHQTGSDQTLLDDILAAAESDDEVQSEVANYLGAGVETTSALIAWSFYYILSDPELRSKVKAEARSLSWPIQSHETLKTCPIIFSTLNEVLRYLPPLWGTSRRAIQEDVVQGYHIPKGSEIILSHYHVNRSPQLFNQPADLVPERFVYDAAPHESLSFGYGPRTCTGRHLVMTEVSLLLIAFFRSYNLRLAKSEIIPHDQGMRPIRTVNIIIE